MKMYKSTEALDTRANTTSSNNEVMINKGSQKRKIVFLVSILVCVVGIGALTATTVLLLTKDNNSNAETNGHSECGGIRYNVKVRQFYRKIQSKHSELHPEAILKDENGVLSLESLFLNFTPAVYKARTQTAKELLKELETIGATSTLSNEESQTFELFRKFLLDTFGTPYENNYEIGDWLLGPNIFCWQESCLKLISLHMTLKNIKPKTVQDVELMVDVMKKCSEGYQQRTRNLQYGISAGIVLPDVACRAGLQNFKRAHVQVAKNGEQGIFNMGILDPSILQNVNNGEKLKWYEKYNVSIMRHLNQSLLNYVGKSLSNFIRYLEEDYLIHCPPSDISSGFASLPLPYVYTNGVANYSRPTTGRLPCGERYNGSAAYLILLSHFTTYDITPQEIDQLADKKLQELFTQVVKIAKAKTKKANETEAITKFRSLLQSDEFFYQVKNETNHSELYMKCYDDKTARKYCPERWQAMTRWLQSARATLNILRVKIKDAFHITGKKGMLPMCPVEIKFDYDPANPYHSYSEGIAGCNDLATIYVPFFLERLGPNYEEMTVMAHEAYPGHHLEVQGVFEHFPIECDDLRKWVSKRNYYAAFSEGWATYVEKDVGDLDMKLYENVMDRYGMLRHQILAALRAKVDVGVHFLGMKRREAVLLYEKYALDTSDVIQKEITRLQSAPGQGTAYMVGEEKFSEYRAKTKDKLGAKFNVQDFHYETLRQGELPILYLGKQIDEYIERELKKG